MTDPLDMAQIEWELEYARTEPPSDCLTGPKYVKVKWDYYTLGIFDDEGCPAGLEDLPVDETIWVRLLDWSQRYQRMAEDAFHDDTPQTGLLVFGYEGFVIACDIKRALPDWQVDYFNRSGGLGSDKDRPWNMTITLDMTQETHTPWS